MVQVDGAEAVAAAAEAAVFVVVAAEVVGGAVIDGAGGGLSFGAEAAVGVALVHHQSMSSVEIASVQVVCRLYLCEDLNDLPIAALSR